MDLIITILPVVTKDLPISTPVHALQFFYRDASSALLQLVNQWLNFTHSRSHAFRYERKNTNTTLFGKNRTHDFRTSRCADYLLDHSGDYILYTISCILYPTYYILYTIYYILYTTYFILHTIYYILHTIYYILHTI